MRTIFLSLIVALALALAPLAEAQNTLNYKQQGGAVWTIGGELNVLSTGVLQADTREITGAQLSNVTRQLSSLTAAGAAFLGTQETEAILGSGSYSIDASSVFAGDTIRFSIAVKVALGVSDDTLRMRVRLGGLTGTVIADSTAIDIVTGDHYVFNGEIDAYTVGASGTGNAVCNLLADADAGNGNNTEVTALSATDFNSALVLCLTGVYDASAADTNSASVQQFSVWQN